MLAVVTAAAACSSSGSTASPATSAAADASTSAAAGSSSAAPSASPIVIGSIGDNGSSSTAGAEEQATLNAWLKWTNAHGGIDGHSVQAQFTVEGSDAAAMLGTIKQWVQQDHIIALAGVDSPNTEAAWGTYAEAEGIPVMGKAAEPLTWSTNPVFFPAGNTEYQSSIIAEMKSEGAKSLGIMTCTVAECTSFADSFKPYATASTVPLEFTGLAPLATADYSAYCLRAKSLDIGAIFLGVPSPQQVIDQCTAQGYKPIWATGLSNLTPALIADSNANGTLTVSPTLPFFLTNSANAQMTAALSEYGNGVKPDGTTSNAWAGLQLFAAAAKEASGNLTSAGLLAALKSMKGETLGGLAPPLTFTTGSHAVPCGFIVKIQNKGLVAPHGAAALCPAGAATQS